MKISEYRVRCPVGVNRVDWAMSGSGLLLPDFGEDTTPAAPAWKAAKKPWPPRRPQVPKTSVASWIFNSEQGIISTIHGS
jgi:hypothetical protein